MDIERDANMLGSMANKLGVPADQVYFFVGQSFCLACSILYRKFLPPWTTSATTRHLVTMVIGVIVGVLSFGMQFLHVVLQATICFLGIQFLPNHIMHKFVFVVSIGYLVLLHLYRAYIQPADVLYSIDVSGPVMIATQKLTSLAFGLHDSHVNQDKLTPLQKKLLVRKSPSPLEFFSYLCCFQGLLVGPLCFYSDYIAYIEGTDIQQRWEKDGQNNNKFSCQHSPSPLDAVVKKLLIMGFWLGFHVAFRLSYPEALLIDSEFVSGHSFVYMVWYMVMCMLCCRAKYYIAFSLGDVICNASGLGFNGYDEKGAPKWDKVTNINILGIEFATSPKLYIDNWNIQSSLWLRQVAYDRVPYQKRLSTFLLSALWHGCYPGYYFTFMFGVPIMEVARLVRRKVRPYFLQGTIRKFLYDVVTWLSTQVVLSYMAVPFTVLHLMPTLQFYTNFYWFLHILFFVLFFTLPSLPTPKAEDQSNSHTQVVTRTQNQSVKTVDNQSTGSNSVHEAAIENKPGNEVGKGDMESVELSVKKDL